MPFGMQSSAKAALALDHVLEGLGRALEQHGGARLEDGDLDAADLRAVVAMEQHQMAAIVDDGDDELQPVLPGRGFAGGGDRLGGFDGEGGLGREHGFLLEIQSETPSVFTQARPSSVPARGLYSQPDPAGVAEPVERRENRAIGDLAFVRLGAARHRGDLHMADVGQVPFEPLQSRRPR